MEFTLTHEFNTTPQKLYQAFLDSKIHSEMTGAKAEVSDVEGDIFTAWDGYIAGKNLELIPNSKIRQEWRTSEFADDQEDSIVEITFKELAPNKTLLTLKHSHLNDSDDQYKQGWVESYFEPMTKYLAS